MLMHHPFLLTAKWQSEYNMNDIWPGLSDGKAIWRKMLIKKTINRIGCTLLLTILILASGLYVYAGEKEEPDV